MVEHWSTSADNFDGLSVASASKDLMCTEAPGCIGLWLSEFDSGLWALFLMLTADSWSMQVGQNLKDGP